MLTEDKSGLHGISESIAHLVPAEEDHLLVVGATRRLHRLYLLDREHWTAPLELCLLLERSELEVAVVHDLILAGLDCQTYSLLLEPFGRRDVE